MSPPTVNKSEILEFIYAKSRTLRDEEKVHWIGGDATAEFVTYQRDVIQREQPVSNEKAVSTAITAVLASISTAMREEISTSISWRKYGQRNAFHYGRKVNFKAIYLYSQGKVSPLTTPDASPSSSPEHSPKRKRGDGKGEAEQEMKRQTIEELKVDASKVPEITKLLLEEVRDLKRLQYEIRRGLDHGSTKFFTWKREEIPEVGLFDFESLRKSLNSDIYVEMLDVLEVKPGILSYKFDATFKHPNTNEAFVLKNLPSGLAARDGKYAHKLKKFIREKEICV
tara:strand:+ start:5404 stop:6252 length:849 start_codon:yes stop_codon:yes gene_type:complete